MDDTVLWDLGTFWPRATHPLAPPCYTERVIPELLRRVGHLAPHDDDIVVLSAQSQGSVIAAALVLQLSGADALVATCRRADRRGVRLALADLFRPSDPIGGAVFYRYRITVDDNADVDWQLMDPAVDPSPGDPAWPRAYGHSDHFRDPAFTTALMLLETTTRHAGPVTMEEPADRP